jgi:hypothetical protein
MESSSRTLLILSLPVAFLLALGAQYFPPAQFALYLATVQIHEFGHAFMAWLSGRRALPLFIGWTNVNPERSLLVYACFAFLIGVTIWKSCQHRAWYLAGVGVVLLLFQAWFTFRLDMDQFEALMVWGGVGGEFWISTLLVIAFYFKMPDKVRWDFFRYIGLFVGAYTFLRSYLLWRQISNREASVPWGTMWGGETDAGGDMNRLTEDFGWSDHQLIRSYMRTAHFCLFGMVGTYLAFLAHSFLPKAEPPAPAKPESRRRRFHPIATPQPPPLPVATRSVYVYVNDAVTGPIEAAQLPAMISDGTIQRETPCCVVGTEDWRTVADFVQMPGL